MRKHARRVSFGRRAEDRQIVVELLCEDKKRILSDINYMLHHMDGAREYLEEVLAIAQASGFMFDKDREIE